MSKRYIAIHEGNVSVWDDEQQSPIIVSFHAGKDLRVPGGVRYYRRCQDGASGRAVVRTRVSKAEYDRNTTGTMR